MAGILDAGGDDVHALRDPTRGGVASALNEIAAQAGVGIRLTESAIPFQGEVRAACEILGFDPLYVANEGKCIAIVAPRTADAAWAALRADPLGREAVIIGEVVAEHPGKVTMRTRIGGTRIVDMLSGEQLRGFARQGSKPRRHGVHGGILIWSPCLSSHREASHCLRGKTR